MKLLLDTHVWLHSMLDPRRLGRKARVALDNPRNEVWLSPISVVELVLLVRAGRVKTIRDPGIWARHAIQAAELREAPLSADIATECDNFELIGADPFDRMIVATARYLQLTLITHDRGIIGSGAVALLDDR